MGGCFTASELLLGLIFLSYNDVKLLQESLDPVGYAPKIKQRAVGPSLQV